MHETALLLKQRTMKPQRSSSAYLLNDIMHNFSEVKKLLLSLPPFILLASLFIFLFLYFLITGEGSIQSAWLRLILFPAFAVNILLAHFIFRKYFRAGKFFIAWISELILSALIIYLLL